MGFRGSRVQIPPSRLRPPPIGGGLVVTARLAPADIKLRRVRYPVQGRDDFSITSNKNGKTFSAGDTLPRILAPKSALAIEARLMKRKDVKRIGDIAKVELGYVTGDNGFFHLSTADAKRFGLSDTHLTKALTRERDLLGVRFTAADWKRRMKEGARDWLLTPTNGQSRAVRNLLKRKAGRRRTAVTSATFGNPGGAFPSPTHHERSWSIWGARRESSRIPRGRRY